MSRVTFLLASTVLAPFVLLACGGEPAAVAEGSESSNLGVADGPSPRIAPASLANLANPELLLQSPQIGTRRFEVYRPDGSVLRYRERVAVDGTGAFAVDPIEPLSPTVPAWDTFALLQGRRAGFVFRYRDFAIRDIELFQENWTLEELGVNQEVAGRLASKFVARRQDGSGSTYEVLIDRRGLVLAYRELDADGVLVSRMVYETLDASPDAGELASVLWHEPTVGQHRLDPVQPLAPQIPQLGTARLFVPRLLPDGYQLREAAVLQDDDRRWLKLTYSDGVEPLFFAVDLPELQPASLPGGDADGLPDPTFAPNTPDRVIVAEMGRATAVQGKLRGRQVMAVGKVGVEALLDLVESSLP